jgi:hypothetical protein
MKIIQVELTFAELISLRVFAEARLKEISQLEHDFQVWEYLNDVKHGIEQLKQVIEIESKDNDKK